VASSWIAPFSGVYPPTRLDAAWSDGVKLKLRKRSVVGQASIKKAQANQLALQV